MANENEMTVPAETGGIAIEQDVQPPHGWGQCQWAAADTKPPPRCRGLWFLAVSGVIVVGGLAGVGYLVYDRCYAADDPHRSC